MRISLAILAILTLAAVANAAQPTTAPIQLPDLTSRDNISNSIQMIASIGIISLAPALLLMMTSFTRIIIVLSLLRQALGTQSLPPNQVLMGLSLFMTFLVMAPTYNRINNDALQPYLNKQIDQSTALDRAKGPVRDFMTKQIQQSGNDQDVFVFTDAARQPRPQSWDQVNMTALIPAFMLSELKTSFLMGFKIYLPFLVIDLVVSTLLVSMGMIMLPPVLISLPFKLAMLVLADGWRLITANLLGSFVPS
jgi:flagellar biosynthesis protein FliP